jgi:hypothetical protein
MYIMYMCPVKSWTLGDSYFAEYRQMCRRIRCCITCFYDCKFGIIFYLERAITALCSIVRNRCNVAKVTVKG